MTIYKFEIDPNTVNWKAFNDAMAEHQEEQIKYMKKVAEELGVSFKCGCDIVYLRGRSRWTQEKEDYLIKLDKEGKELPDCFKDFEVK